MRVLHKHRKCENVVKWGSRVKGEQETHNDMAHSLRWGVYAACMETVRNLIPVNTTSFMNCKHALLTVKPERIGFPIHHQMRMNNARFSDQ
jgi:hypothetical protein